MRSPHQSALPWLPPFISCIIVASVLFLSLSITCNQSPGFAQGRGLGFRGLVPPSNAKKRQIDGEVTVIDLPLIRIKDRVWHSSKVFIGPPNFLNEQGFLMHKGQSVRVEAAVVKVEGSEIYVAFWIEDTDSGKKVVLRDAKGEPIWWAGGTETGKGAKRGPGYSQ